MRDMKKFLIYNKLWQKTPPGRANKMWFHILERAENRNGKCPTYKNIKVKITRENFKKLVIPKIKLFMKKYPNEIPSVDRIDNNGHYEKENIQIISLSENMIKKNRNKRLFSPSGKSWCSACKKYFQLSFFGKDKSMCNGVEHRCKICRTLIAKKRYLKQKMSKH